VGRKMKKALLVGCCFLLVGALALMGSAEAVETLVGKAKGFGGEIIVTVTKQGDKIIAVEAVGERETPAIAGPALEKIPQMIVEANSTDVDVITNATITSKAIIYAVNNALDPENYPAPAEEAKKAVEPKAVTAAKVYQGFGLSNMHRFGPGADDTGTPVYSINQVMAHVLFDEEGRILALHVDQLEVATPNYDGDGMPHFSGFPGQGGYNWDMDHDGKVDGKTEDTVENFAAEVAGWRTKRERGDSYRMGVGTWADQMDTFERLFVGMTVDEVEEWFAKYTSDRNGRPLKPGSTNEQDKAKFDALTAEEQAMLADVVTGATMSLNDSHGNIVEAIRFAYENRIGLDINGAASMGLGLLSTHRVGPGSDDTGTPVYSINQVFANTLFDGEGRIAAIHVDQLEISTPNYDGAGMPHFSGFPGQGGYNLDLDHDGKVDGKTGDSEAFFAAEIASWKTKRERGQGYRMGVGTWADQMNTFEELFVGMTVDEVEEWFAKYTSDRNGRPLKPDSTNEQDKAKFDALTAEEQAMLADVVTGATMSLNDSHGDIVGAIRKSFENRVTIDLTIED
jgi:major membrane immunogen (membrane-anchored lipoprotein)